MEELRSGMAEEAAEKTRLVARLGGAALGESEELSVEHGLGRVVEALRNTVWGSLDMKPRSSSGAAAGSGGGSGRRHCR